ncbi:cation:proton antiporter [Chitinispirillales bacterium ANBcel5]|uniref:cation:proton antiporter domain-containing protein n=1 Tax=Cellulosispirillum alkaliphilum TaxID=3039283 RepID=UPI002A518159|nr:cation:proton antiporter [Chitinispirillales bacterium ANBcel5]
MLKNKRWVLSVCSFILLFGLNARAAEATQADSIIHLMADLMFQLGVIIIIARSAHVLFEKLHISSVLGELVIGMIIGPYLLGSIGLPGFPDGIFPVVEQNAVSVSPQLYGVATIASVLLLFTTGLEVDLALLFKYSVTGIVVGVGGVLFSFFGGAALGAVFLQTSLFDPRVMFLGVIACATSMGITARVLSEKRKMDSPEGVTILAGAVIGDVLGIILLAVVSSLFVALRGGMQEENDISVGLIAIRAITVWVGFTAGGILFARHLSRLMKKLKSVVYISVAAFGGALILAGIFEKAGLAMIIGGYVMGLSLSKTDLNDTIRATLETLNAFFVPVFFVVMGMMVNLFDLLTLDTLILGAVFTVVAIIAKIVGCGFPALFFNFNRFGATRVGVGMVPRGEVALIIAGIGLSMRIIDQSLFDASIIMTLVTTVLAPPVLSKLMDSEKRGTRKVVKVRETETTSFDFSTFELNELLTSKVLQAFRGEGFFIHTMSIFGHTVYHLRRDEISITMKTKEEVLEFETDAQDVIFVKTIVYETLLQLNSTITRVKDLIRPEVFLRGLTEETARGEPDISRILDARCIIPDLKSQSKTGIIEELLDVIDKNGLVSDRESALNAVMERENSMSTGMQYGIALPHGKTDTVSKVTVSVGISRKGVDFQSLDGQPSTIFVMVLSPLTVTGPHIQFLASLSALLNSSQAREELLNCKTAEEIFWFFRKRLGK